MDFLWVMLLLGLCVNSAAFLIIWNLRGRGFGELAFWRRSSAAADPSADRPETRPGG